MTTTFPSNSRRKLRVLVITMPGSERKNYIEAMFAHPTLACHFEPPRFSDGVPSRLLKNRFGFLKTCHQAGLLPQAEWLALQAKQESLTEECPNQYFDCLDNVPIQEGRRGSKNDVKLHYSVELWRKAKGINRGRAVMGCLLAHLIALKRFTSQEEEFDVMLEDNIRAVTADAAERIWRSKEANTGSDDKCHMKFMGWLGSLPNLEWILTRHAPKRAIRANTSGGDETSYTVMPYPNPQEIEDDLAENGELPGVLGDHNNGNAHNKNKVTLHTKPGGTPVWGSYAYWMSKEGYEALLQRIQNDVGALLWKGKRGRYYHVKPADKVLPRILREHFGETSVYLSTYPAFFRAPMLTSKIHTAFDPEFCKSTEYQLQQCGNLTWDDLWLSDEEREIIQHRQETGEWITLGRLREMKNA